MKLGIECHLGISPYGVIRAYAKCGLEKVRQWPEQGLIPVLNDLFAFHTFSS
jgi:hypothetical protein